MIYCLKVLAIGFEFRRQVFRTAKKFRRLAVAFRDVLFGPGFVKKDPDVESILAVLQQNSDGEMSDDEVKEIQELCQIGEELNGYPLGLEIHEAVRVLNEN
jgi:hypothetical protein